MKGEEALQMVLEQHLEHPAFYAAMEDEDLGGYLAKINPDHLHMVSDDVWHEVDEEYLDGFSDEVLPE